MFLVRYILIGVIAYLLIRSLIRIGDEGPTAKRSDGSENTKKPFNKKISKEIGEYVDYEEVDKNPR